MAYIVSTLEGKACNYINLYLDNNSSFTTLTSVSDITRILEDTYSNKFS